MLSSISSSFYNLDRFSSNIAEANSAAKNSGNSVKNEAYYAKRGESIYQRDMDLDKDGVISFDEFHEYCRSNNADVQQLLKSWVTYRTTKGIDETSQEDEKKEKEEKQEEDISAVYARKGDNKYDSVMDSNEDGKITYKEYLEYCRQHAKEEKKDSNAKIEDQDGKIEIKNSIQAIDAYTKTEAPEGKIETVA